MSWYNTGPENREDPPKRDWGPRRFYLPVGADTQVTFVDDDTKAYVFEVNGKKVKLKAGVFMFKEHQLYMNGTWQNWFSCRHPVDADCILCDSEGTTKDGASQVAARTVIDHSKWKDKKGDLHVNELRLFVYKTSSATFLKLEKQAEKRGGLRGCKYSVARLADKSCNVGDDFEFEERVDLKDDVQPFNYLELFEPQSNEELQKVTGAVKAEEDEPVRY